MIYVYSDAMSVYVFFLEGFNTRPALDIRTEEVEEVVLGMEEEF